MKKIAIARLGIKIISIILMFSPFLLQFQFYDAWNSKIDTLELYSLRYKLSINGANNLKVIVPD